jgi:BirA family biotin operon repressor/biotin-[acetyl-CoA-carboxylase] ligase
LEEARGISAVHVFEQIDSTNRVAMELGTQGAPHGTLVVARSQSAGKGRAGRQWFSPKGQLYLSLLWRLAWPAERTPQVTLDVAVSVARAVQEELGFPPTLRWPNDLLINGRKCCGILTELRTEGAMSAFVVVGIGVNVLPFGENLPAELSESAVSLSDHTEEPVPLVGFAIRLLNQLDSGYRAMLARGGFDRESWRQYASVLGQAVTVSPPGAAEYTARAVDIDEQGLLVVETSSGRRQRVVAGDVRVREVH